MTWKTTPTLIAAQEAYYAELGRIKELSRAALAAYEAAQRAEQARKLAHYLAIYEAGWPGIPGYRESFLASCRKYGVVP